MQACAVVSSLRRLCSVQFAVLGRTLPAKAVLCVSRRAPSAARDGALSLANTRVAVKAYVLRPTTTLACFGVL
eukprot:15481109-Alexandrium_andersonii.AAC.1